jgi:CHRD domain
MRWGLATMMIAPLALIAAAASADTVHFSARLTSRAEAPPNASKAVGEIQADLDTDARLLTYKLTYQGLTGPATAARLQGPAKSGQTAPPILSVDDVSNPISGNATLTPAQVADLKKGLWYVNIATTANPDGEIRGQLKWQVDWGKAEQPATPTPPMQMYRPSANLSNR